MQKEHKWPGLKSIEMVATTVNKGDKVLEERRFYISSLSTNTRQLNQTARLDWGIENQLHWRLAVAFNEDGACNQFFDCTRGMNHGLVQGGRAAPPPLGINLPWM